MWHLKQCILRPAAWHFYGPGERHERGGKRNSAVLTVNQGNIKLLACKRACAQHHGTCPRASLDRAKEHPQRQQEHRVQPPTRDPTGPSATKMGMERDGKKHRIGAAQRICNFRVSEPRT